MQVAPRLAVATAVSAGLYIGGMYFAPVATPCLLLVPLPALILAQRVSWTFAALSVALVTALVGIAVGEFPALSYVLLFGVPAVAAALAVSRQWSFDRTAIAAVLTWCAGLTTLTAAAYGTPSAIVGAARAQLAHGVDLALDTYRSIGAPESTLAILEADRDLMITGMLEILPAVLVLMGAVIVLANLILLRRWDPAAPSVDLRLWRTPDALIWALIVAGFGMFVPVPLLAVLARNAFLVLLGCYFCQGLAIVSFYLDRYHLPRGLRVASYLLIAVQHIVALLVVAVGVFDLWGNFRRLGAANVPVHPDSD